ncbi:exopolysaccharide biosynthesis polyprenyl glycosylphosphotransferase [Pseudaquidulcibacter saccharophilus]|uniref:exopolysaccharide biosynthesis polyprenyl glycosylphosphotransferase n=1 Tax=Pseudaquidulcibacter saccharophilus TaxID=2831900 RepID=UPI001EFF0318|nr:exopolysaccharide biosynthesis polyprenyl glycosylphosphotransferase [Pseudaquidulcibacter saccharophilus]
MLSANTAKRLLENTNSLHGKRAARGARIFRSGFAKALEIFDFFAVAFLMAVTLRLYIADRLLSADLAITMPFAFSAAGLWWVARENDLYHFTSRPSPLKHFLNTLGAIVIAMPLAIVIGFLVSGISARPWQETVGEATFMVASAGVILLITHTISAAVVKRLSESGFFSMNIVVVGATKQAKVLINKLKAGGDFNFLGIFDDRLSRAPKEINGVPVLGDLDALMEWSQLPTIDRVVITVSSAAQERVLQLTEKLRSMPNKLVLAIDMQGFEVDGITIGNLGAFPVAYVSGSPEDAKRAFWKRVQDLTLSIMALILLSPIMLATAIAIKLESKGPVFFRQKRHGFNNQEFYCFKFRSMFIEQCDYQAAQQVVQDDPRVTKIGKFIRKTSIDELPQLFNVILGDMSLVGPRPHAIGMKTGDDLSEKLVSDYAHRHRIKPGITGWAAIHGSRGPVHTPEEVEERVNYDVEYIENSGLWMDLYIIMMTIPSLLGDKVKIR